MSRYEDAILFVVLAIAWGAGFSAIEVGLETIPPILFAAFRFDIGAAVTVVALAALGRLDRPTTRADLGAIVVAASLLVFANVFFLFFGQLYTSGSIASVVYSLNPVLTVGFAAVLLSGGGLGPRDAVGIVLGLLGVVLIARPSPTAVAEPPAGAPAVLDGAFALFGPDGLGALLVFCAVIAVAAGSVLLRRVDAPMASLPTTGWAMALGALMLHAASLGIGESVMLPSGTWTWVAVGYVGVVASSVGYGAYFTLMRRRGPFTANLVSYAVPAVASVTGWALLDEQLPPLAIAGFVCILAGFLVLNRTVVAEELRTLRA
ncbi:MULTISPECIES: DMT family transporter [Halolamina]|uniref:Permease of the drug/metabolite transporter (DMT) superfamily n=1 Tax=Halolamina pelagica TaxID=699431 RepID=A0A1I5MCT4_9EURY|nr:MULTISPECIES: DMT family transporter [Halolamina]NHX35971.1 DMT family transporter [Halolamina sp. R1-12]SFP07372.1 Permease of the drug/metabolite transporter (DMT) superfamily [Halolamina pelagica]